MRNKTGFTLIEIMVSLVLVGIIASIAGTSVLMGMKGYVTSRENNVLTQKAQLALNRIHREFIELSEVQDGKERCLIYQGPYGRRALKWFENDKTIRLFTNADAISCDALSSGDTLVDGVQSLSIQYFSNASGPWTTAQDIRSLCALTVQIRMMRPDMADGILFSTTVSPRNNGNAGGAAIPTPDNKPPEYASKYCFVATAAWGDGHHPMVELLREFRDDVLLKAEPGISLVRLYYRVGPTLAAAIENKPLACLAVRVMMIPLAGVALLALHSPLLIPLALILSWWIARSIPAQRKGRFRSRLSRLTGERGAILLTLIAVMVVFSALSAVMITMFGSTSLGQAMGSNVMRAYYLAESGFRYAASTYINAADETTRENLMLAMHNQEYTLADNEGKFRILVYPYYARLTELSNGDELTAKVSGGFPVPEGDFVSDSWVKVQRPDGVVTYNQISQVSPQEPNTLRFCRSNAAGSPLWDTGYETGSLITPVCLPDRNVNNRKLIINQDGRYDLAYKEGTGALAFPERNGVFSVRFEGEPTPRMLSYRHRNRDTRRFEGISDTGGRSLPNGPMVEPGSSAPYKNFIELAKFVRLESTGILGAGAAEVSRKITYEIPLGYMTAAAPKTEMKEQFGSSLANWFTGSEISHIGTQAIEGGALRVTSPQTTNVSPTSSCLLFRENQIALNWEKAFSSSGAQENFETEWKRAGRYLSYDVQAKLKLDSTNQTYAGGLSFRLDEAGNSLGLTILSSVPGFYTTDGCDKDGIPNGMTTVTAIIQYNPYLVLWMKEAARTEKSVVIVPSPHLDPASADLNDPPPTGTGTNAILIGPCSFWETGNRVQFTNVEGSLPQGISSSVDYFIRVVTYDNKKYLYLFDTYKQAMGLAATRWEGLRDMKTDGSGTSNMVAQDPLWTELLRKNLNASPYSSDVYRILKTEGNQYIHFREWTTLMVRIIEAPSVSFINGGGAGLEIVSGNVVYQTQEDTAGGTVTAIALVRSDPVYWNRFDQQPTEWNWEAGTAAGVLMLEILKDGETIRPYTFASGKKIFVGNPPSGTWVATAGIPSTVTDEGVTMRNRDNWIQVFVGDKDGPANPNDNPLDINRGLSPRDQIFWSPDRVGYPGITTTSNDRFSLVKMGDSRNLCFARRFLSRQNAGDRGDFIRLGKPLYDGSAFFSTPASGSDFSRSRPEVGLHSYGPADSMTNFYFDDFAVRFGPVSGVRAGFLMPVQR
ncbi:MAG: prepilin-type N-terminal cleavage/methylation domain-containing protein [Deltaproteobacteria bacterium]|jgi:prepilin-type N-terminal cleavage/methylation domain-containing protein|nr:prepilin-type N-terminal cleavage/methylation domain-containing protein [Deltaproteobacteria bacterium]